MYGEYRYRSDMLNEWKRKNTLCKRTRKKVMLWCKKAPVERKDKDRIVKWMLQDEKRFCALMKKGIRNPYFCYLVAKGLLSRRNFATARKILRFSANKQALWIFHEANDESEALSFFLKKRMEEYKALNG